MRRRGGYGHNFWQRLSIFSPELKDRLSEGGWFWVHGVSVGEVFVALRFMDEVRKKQPETRFVLTVTTSTGHGIALDKIDERDVVLYFPVDIPSIMRRMLNLIKPQALAMIETEIWPNLIRLANARDISIYMINGRMSDGSFRGYGWVRSFTSRVLPWMRRIFVQSDLDRERFIALGAPASNIEVVGTAKYETAVCDDGEACKGREILNAAGCAVDARILLGASTWAGEEEVLLDLYIELRQEYKDLFLVLVPRHAERREEVLKMIATRNLSVVTRRDVCAETVEAGVKPDLFLVDTTGELSSFYSHADIVFVGKSLTQHGGQNPIEAAACGCAVVVGPNMENFRIVMDDFRKNNAILEARNSNGLRDCFEELLADDERRIELGECALKTVKQGRGAIVRTVEMMELNG